MPRSRAKVLGALLAFATALVAAGCGHGAKDLTIPVVYIVSGKVVDPTSSPLNPLAGATVTVETGSGVSVATSDANGVFILQGVPPGEHRLRAQLAGCRATLSAGITIARNVTNAIVPLFTDAEIDSILSARAAPAWDRGLGLFGLFALKSTGVPLGDAVLGLTPPPGGTLVQTGEGKDPIVLVNAAPGDYGLTVTRSGFVWDGPIGAALRPGVVTFGAPRARANLSGYVFADRGSGSAIEGATVTIAAGPTRVSATTSFLGQFLLVGLARGTYVARIAAAGFLPALTWPQPMDQDTTLATVVVEPDTLAAWSAALGGPAPLAGAGTLVVDARTATGGAVLEGATIGLNLGGGVALPQSGGIPALRMNVPPGTYKVTVTAPGYPGSVTTGDVVVRAGETTYSRLEF